MHKRVRFCLCFTLIILDTYQYRFNVVFHSKSLSVEQWTVEFKSRTTIKENKIAKFTTNDKKKVHSSSLSAGVLGSRSKMY